MHISEGVLSAPVLISGAALTAVGTGIGLKNLDYDRIAGAGLLASCFFVASLIHIPMGPSNVHLILNGVVGLLLGWAAFPVILVALVLQGLFFQFGGLTTLGVNTLIMALPAVIGFYIFRPLLWKSDFVSTTAAAACGFFSVLFAAVLAALSLYFTEKQFISVALLIAAAHGPVMVIEGIVTAFFVNFLKKVQPAMLPVYSFHSRTRQRVKFSENKHEK